MDKVTGPRSELILGRAGLELGGLLQTSCSQLSAETMLVSVLTYLLNGII